MNNPPVYPWLSDKFDRLIGQRNSLAHAYLLAGQAGLGKTVFTEQFAQAMLCKQSTPFACGQCQSCHLFISATHPDLHVLQSEKYSLEHPGILSDYAERYPVPESKRKTPSAVITIDQVRAVLPDINARPHMADCRIIVLNPAEDLNINAANCLLKALEEPPPDTYFLLISHDPDRLLPTLRSRCNRIDFRVPDALVAEQWLSQQLNDTTRANSLLAKARGVPLRALSLGQNGTDDLEQQLANLLMQLAENMTDPVTAAAGIMKDKQFVLRAVLESIQQLIVALIKNNFSVATESVNLQEIGNRLHSRELFGYFDYVSIAVRQTNTPLDDGLILEDILSRWQELTSNQQEKKLRG